MKEELGSSQGGDPPGFDPNYLRDLAEVLLFIADSNHIKHTATSFRGEVRSWRRLLTIAADILDSIAAENATNNPRSSDPGINKESVSP